MRKIKELKSTDLTFKINASQFNFKTTDDISGYNGIIGQKRALETVETALEMPQKGFNLYVCGQVGMGKMPYVLSIVNKLAKTKPVPNDLCYIHNFENPNEPIVIFLKAGEGRIFKEAMNRFISTVRKDLLKIFASENYEKEKKVITKQYEAKKNAIMHAFDKHTTAQGFKASWDIQEDDNSVMFRIQGELYRVHYQNGRFSLYKYYHVGESTDLELLKRAIIPTEEHIFGMKVFVTSQNEKSASIIFQFSSLFKSVKELQLHFPRCLSILHQGIVFHRERYAELEGDGELVGMEAVTENQVEHKVFS